MRMQNEKAKLEEESDSCILICSFDFSSLLSDISLRTWSLF
jgi:hypothetical protein